MSNHRQQSLMSRYQRALILNSVRRHNLLSRTRLRLLTGIRMATITERVRELLAEGFLVEAGAQGRRRGRKQKLLKINGAKGLVIGLDISAAGLTSLLVDLEGRIIACHRVGSPFKAGRRAMMRQVIRAIEAVLKKADGARGRLLGIGVADPGLVDRRRGISVFSSTIRGWRNIPLKACLARRFKTPVAIEADCRAKALLEQRMGVGRQVQNLLLVEYGAGIGCGLIVHGELYRGFTESAGELGHMQVLENGPRCSCGGFGCLEAVAALPAMVKQAVRAIRQGAPSRIMTLAGGRRRPVTAEHLLAAARQKDPLALRIVQTAARQLGMALANAVNYFNPEMIVLDAGFARVADLMLATLRKTVARQALSVATRSLVIRVSRMGEDAGALGAATLMLDRIFAIPQLKVPDDLRIGPGIGGPAERR